MNDKVVPTLTIQFETDEQLETFLCALLYNPEGVHDLDERLIEKAVEIKRRLTQPNPSEPFLEVV